jgi:hypothetical protein
VFFISSINLYAEEKQNTPPKISMGLGGSFSYYNIYHKQGEYPEWDGGFGYGGGFIFESMLTDMFGIHSGIWFSRMKITLKSPEDRNSTDDVIVEREIQSDFITLPFYLITSFGSRSISLNILTGLNFSVILSSHIYSDSENSEDVKNNLGTGQLGVGGGIEIITRITRFTGIFISGVAEYYLTELLSEVQGTSDHIYNFQVRSGFLLFTF